MNKKRLLSIVLTLLVLSAALCGTVFAYMFRQTEFVENEFTPAQVSCRVEESVTDTAKNSITVQNTGNIDAYLRLRLVSYWVDEESKIVGKPSEMPVVSLGAGWVKDPNSDTYYYQNPVAPGSFTGNLLKNPISMQESSEGYFQVIEVFAEAIQSLPEIAVETAWGVTIENGTIQ